LIFVVPLPALEPPASTAGMAAMNVTAKQFLKDFAFTCGAAMATGGIVSAIAATVILIFARGS
jgi:hypothetical protein